MATAEQLLAEVTEVDKKLYIDFDTRQILIPNSIHQLGVESDDDVKKLTFSVPKTYYDCDLSTFRIFINYMNANKEGDLFSVKKEDVREVDGNLEFDWLVGRHAVAYKGTAIFNVCMKKGSMQPDPEDGTQEIFVVDQEFNTTVAKLPVLEGLETSEAFVQEYADTFMQWENEVFNVKIPEYIEAHPDQFKGEKGDPGQNGASPTLSENKVGKVTTVTVTDGNGTHTFELNDGADGKDGTSITILGSYSTEAELIAAHPTGNKGDSYLVSGYLYVWDVNTSAWKNVGSIQGPAGTDGIDGTNGVSPTVTISKDGTVTTITITDVNGPHTATINDGIDGQDGTNGTNGTDGTDGIDGVSPTVEISKTGKVTTITITDATGPHTAIINDGVDGTGAGDMLMATYDTDGDGIVDDSEKLGGVAADQYALKTDIPNKAADSDKLGGVVASEYALKTDTAPDSSKLGGVSASDYALKTDIPEKASDSDKLGGLPAEQYALKTDTAPDSSKLGGVAASDYALKTDIPEKASDSDKLGGVAASKYALKTDTAPDSSKLGGVVASGYALKTDIPEIPTYTMSATDDGNGNVTISIGG